MQSLNAIVCDKHRSALIYIHHFKKGQSVDLLDKSSGSPAIAASVRQVLSVVRKSGLVRLIKQAKSNLSATSTDLGVIKVGKELQIYESQEQTEETQKDKAEEFLINLFKDSDKLLASDIFEQGEEIGISSFSLKEAKKNLGIQSKRKSGDKGWFWVWPLGE